MRKRYVLLLLLSSFLFVPAPASEQNGTEVTDGLTDKQLAVLRWFHEVTAANKGENRWKHFYEEPGQLGLTSIRYHLAFMGYAAAALASKTPAYRDVYAKILDDIIRRMLDKKVWEFVKRYWSGKDFFPDPVYFENIMYSGHLAQLMTLYEHVSGDYKYSKEGFDFVWDEKTKIHYTLPKLLDRLYAQMDEDEHGGIPCEPKTVFVYCNNHQQNSFAVYDKIHGTKYCRITPKWNEWMKKTSVVPESQPEVFKVSYLGAIHKWVPHGVAGGDGWGLAWMYPWTDDPEFVRAGWEKLKKNPQWKEGFLQPSEFDAMGGITRGMSSCFVPLVARQVEGKDSEMAKKVFEWYEKNHAKWDDLDGDGHNESFYYNTSFQDRMAVTGALAAAMVTDGDSLRNTYQNPNKPEFFKKPYLAIADYPNVYVKKAEIKNNKLTFTVLKGHPKWFSEKNILVVANLSTKPSVLRDGQPWNAIHYEKGELDIKTDVDTPHEFSVEF